MLTIPFDRCEINGKRSASSLVTIRTAPRNYMPFNGLSVYGYCAVELAEFVDSTLDLVISIPELIRGEKFTVSNEIIYAIIGLVISEGYLNNRRRVVRCHRVCKAQQRLHQRRCFIAAPFAAYVQWKEIGGWRDDEVGAASRATESGLVKIGIDIFWIDIELSKLFVNTIVEFLSYRVSETLAILVKFCHHQRHVLTGRQFPIEKGADGNSNFVKIDPGTFIKTPVYESHGQIRQRFPQFGARKHENLRTDGGNGQATDAFLAQHRTYFLTGITLRG